MARYIELYSRHRNRTQYPNPSSFDVPFLYASTVSPDPILSGAIYYSWTSDEPTTFLPFKSGTTNQAPMLAVSNATPQPRQPNYYAGYVMTVIGESNATESRIVVDYNPQDVKVLLDTAFSFNPPYYLKAGDLYLLFEMNTPSLIHLPIIDHNQNYVLSYAQAYNGYYVMDETLSYGMNIVARKVTDYDYSLRYCHLESDFPAEWSITDSYTLRRSLPTEKWILENAVVDGGYVVFTLPLSASASSSYYIGKYVYFATNAVVGEVTQFTPVYGTYQIVGYDGQTRQLRCFLPSGAYPKQGDTINIVVFEYDNTAPLLYMGSILSQTETVCYEMTLISLTLPNATLTTGSRIAFYPYVYVEFRNSTSGASRDLIYSNNPSSSRALFVVHITDVNQPITTHFVKLIGRMRQTVKFKPTDSLRFSVYLPDGTPFQTVRQDLLSPYEPDGNLQIDVIIGFRRM